MPTIALKEGAPWPVQFQGWKGPVREEVMSSPGKAAGLKSCRSSGRHVLVDQQLVPMTMAQMTSKTIHTAGFLKKVKLQLAIREGL